MVCLSLQTVDAVAMWGIIFIINSSPLPINCQWQGLIESIGLLLLILQGSIRLLSHFLPSFVVHSINFFASRISTLMTFYSAMTLTILNYLQLLMTSFLTLNHFI